MRFLSAFFLAFLLLSPFLHADQHSAQVIRLVHHDLSLPLREIPPVPLPDGPKRALAVRSIPLPQPDASRPVAGELDPGLQTFSGPVSMPAPINSWDGVGDGFTGPQGTYTILYAPPDTNGDVGPNHIVQIVNVAFAVWNKTGTVLYGPVNINTLWSGFGGGCQTNNNGDPVVAYDQFNDRWIISQFSISTSPYLQCVAVSQTGDPTGAYYRFSYSYGTDLNDYGKWGIWGGDYYVAYNMFHNGQVFIGGEVCAIQGAKVRAGQANTMQCFNENDGGLLPADIDGSTLPPAGAPEYVMSFGSNALNIWKLKIDWANSANSTFTGPTAVSVNSFTPACNGGTCITQPGTGQQLDSLADRLMHRLAYRNRSGTESFVVNHSVSVSGSSAIRWYELRTTNSATTTPTLFQQGTYSPDTSHRWMGSIAMDNAGNIAAGYSISSSANSVKPSIRYAGRLISDPAGQFSQGEATLFNGTGVQTGGLTRWGDYSSINTDPGNDCKFWYTTEYIPSNGSFNWHTRIGSFQFASCGGGGDLTPPSTSITSPLNGANVHGTVAITANASDNVGVTNVEFYVDGNLIGNDTTAPYSINWDSTALKDGSHNLTSKAYDAANNNATSTAVAVSVDNTPPTTSITLPTSGATVSGTITVNADAADNAVIAKVEFYANGSLIGSDTSSPYSIQWNTTGSPNGSYNLTSEAYDSAGNSTISAAVPVTISNGAACTTSQLFANSGFESGNVSWTSYPATGNISTSTSTEPSHTGSWRALLGGKGFGNTSSILQQIVIPANACQASFTFWMRIISNETTTSLQNDKIQIQVLNSSNTLLKSLATYSNLNKGATYVAFSFDLLAYKGQTIRLRFLATENGSLKTTFLVDDTGMKVISNGLASCANTQIFLNPGFESGNVNWISAPSTGIIGISTSTDPARTGSWRAKLGGKGIANTSTLYQQVSIPANACVATLSYFQKITTSETTTTLQNDQLKVQVLDSNGVLLQTLATFSNLNHASYVQKTFSLLGFKGQTIRVRFVGVENASLKTTFLLDDTALKTAQ